MHKEVKTTTLGAAVKLAEKLGHLFVATVGEGAMPHVTAAGKLALNDEGLIEVTAWFCPQTVANLQANRAVALVVWDPETDNGYHLLGRVEQFTDLAIMDGYAPEKEDASPFPQTERKLVASVETILAFKHAPHSDMAAA